MPEPDQLSDPAMEFHDQTNPSGFSRRALATGAGVGAALIAAGAIESRAAIAAPQAAGPHVVKPQESRPSGQASSFSAGSPPITGYTYRSATFVDFMPINPTSGRAWSGQGVYSHLANDLMYTSIEVPPGARLRDVEWYFYSTSASHQGGDIYQFPSGSNTLYGLRVEVVTPRTAAGFVTVRHVVTSDNDGPFSLGTHIVARITTPKDGSVAIDGVRLGFTQGAGSTGLLPSPVRVYDSRTSGGKFAAGSTRTITFPSSIVAPGSSGVLINVTATGATKAGYLKVYPASGAVPTASALNFPISSSANPSVANALTVGVSSARQIKIWANQSVHVIVDITATVS